MVEATELQKLKEEYPEFFRKTQTKVVDFVLSEKTSEKIAGIVTKNSINDVEKIEQITQRITWVLLDKLPGGNLAMALELGARLAPEIAKKVADEANQFISSAMVQLKSGENGQPKKELPKEKIIEEPAQDRSAMDEKSKRPSSKDFYREPTE